MRSRIIRQLKMLFSFALLIILLVAVLELLNWMPSIIDSESLRKYGSIELVKRKLHIEKIYMPAYLPEGLNLKWPPSEIYAQKKPFLMILMHFQHRDSADIGLTVYQVDSRTKYQPEPRIKIIRIKNKSRVSIKDREGTLVTAVCENDTPCNKVSWKEGDFLLTVTGKDSERDLIRIAGSMISES